MPTYDATLFDPPAPLAQVILRHRADSGELVTTLMLLDTGADVTLIPATSANQLNLTKDAQAQYELMGFDSARTVATAVQLEMIFLNKIFRGRFLLIDQAWGILGRDVLNLVSISLDGPNLLWTERNPG